MQLLIVLEPAGPYQPVGQGVGAQLPAGQYVLPGHCTAGEGVLLAITGVLQ